MTDERLTKKVSEEDYALLQVHKASREEDAKKQMDFERRNIIATNTNRVDFSQAEIEFKREQMEHEVLEVDDRFVGGLKPKHLLRAEIGDLNLTIANLKELIAETEKLQKLDAA